MRITLEQAIHWLGRGELLAVPTETVYGLAAVADSEEALAALYILKGRPSNHPVILHVSGRSMLSPYVQTLDAVEERLMEAFWPGPLTLILEKSDRVSPRITGGRDTVAVRAPAHPLTLGLLVGLGRPLVAPSANRFGRVSPTSPEHVENEFGSAFPVLDGGPCRVGLESTIVRVEEEQISILRPGTIGREELEMVGDRPVVYPVGETVPGVPGGLKSHYAPSIPVRLVSTADILANLPINAATIIWSDCQPQMENGGVFRLEAEPESYGRQLYSTLRSAEQSGASELWVEAVPPQETWQAVRDRLNRAATRD